MIFGVLVFGFFIGLDMALARERVIIRTALAGGTRRRRGSIP